MASLENGEQVAEIRRSLDDLAAQWQETQLLIETGTAQGAAPDADMLGLLEEIEKEISNATIALLGAMGISTTPPPQTETSPPPPSAHVYQVQWDDGSWYACHVHRPWFDEASKEFGVVAYVLGYRVTERFPIAKLRKWVPPDVHITPGTKCHAIHPQSGVFFEARIDRVTMKGTVWVTFNQNVGGATVELPPSYIHLGKHYRTLKKSSENMTDAEKRREEEAQRERRKDKVIQKKRAREDVLEQNAQDWLTLKSQLSTTPSLVSPLGALGGGPPKKKQQR